jgi:hypothetical protein
MQKTTMTILMVKDNLFEVTAMIGNEEFVLGEYNNVVDAGTKMLKWVTDRGLTWAPDSSLRLSRAQRLDVKHVTFDVISQVESDRLAEERYFAWVPFASDYIWQVQ